MECLKLVAPVGSNMNSYMANLFPACFPPLMTLSDGTGKMNLEVDFPAKFAMY